MNKLLWIYWRILGKVILLLDWIVKGLWEHFKRLNPEAIDEAFNEAMKK